jgi:hypothetical protein
MAGRQPPPPSALASELVGVLDDHPVIPSVLSRAGRTRLDLARARLGRVRGSAFHLLVADALITYACEAALESSDPEDSLRRLVEVGLDR